MHVFLWFFKKKKVVILIQLELFLDVTIVVVVRTLVSVMQRGALVVSLLDSTC